MDERAAAYRSLLAGRRILVVLDNAGSVEQLRPLLPGTPSCLVVVTSRDALAGLVARHGARRLDLDLLPPEDAMALLRALIGERVDAEPDAAATLAEQCARLPLALRIAAELAATRPGSSLAALVAELGDEQRRLNLLDAGGDPRTAVRTVFSWSYHDLLAEAAQTFRLLALHPGPDVDPYATAALTDTTVEQAKQLLDLLARAHLIQPASPGRYGMHDLLRAYATHVAAGEDTEKERRAALTCLFDHYLATAAAAMDTLHPSEQHRRPRIRPPGTPAPSVADPAAALAWLDTERTTLTAVCAHTAAHGWPNHTIRLATTLDRYLDTGGHYPDALTIHTHARHAARRTGDTAAEAHMLNSLGGVYFRRGGYRQAADHLQQTLILAREIVDQTGEANALMNLGAIYWQRGRYQQSADHHQQALKLCREIGHRTGEANALTNLGTDYGRQGRYQQASDHHQHALALFREIGHRTGEATALINLGIVYQWQGHYEQAADYLRQALTLFREIGNRAGEAHALDSLGTVYERQGRYEQAVEHHQQALTFSREIGNRAGEADALNNLGTVCRRQGRHGQAVEHHQQALAFSREIGHRVCEARALNGLAVTHHATGDPEQARHHWRHALDIYIDLGLPEVDDVRARLIALDQELDNTGG